MNSLPCKWPAEWEPHALTLMAWPENRQTWPGKRLKLAQRVIAELAGTIGRHEPVVMLAGSESARSSARSQLKKAVPDIQIEEQHEARPAGPFVKGTVRLVPVPVNDIWIRDYGPMGLKGGVDGEAIIFCDWEYNAWGGKYPPWDRDNAVPAHMARYLKRSLLKPGIVLEGGAIDGNGAGTLLAGEPAICDPKRNPGLSRNRIEEYLKQFSGAKQIIWLDGILAGDDTDGHVDQQARFVGPRTILAMTSHDPAHPNTASLRRNLDRLRKAVDPAGRSFEIIELPMPDTLANGTTVDGSRHLPASYINFYVANGCVLVPRCDERYDEEVLRIFARCFSGRRVIGVQTADLVWGQGGIHCVTMQIPATPQRKISV